MPLILAFKATENVSLWTIPRGPHVSNKLSKCSSVLLIFKLKTEEVTVTVDSTCKRSGVLLIFQFKTEDITVTIAPTGTTRYFAVRKTTHHHRGIIIKTFYVSRANLSGRMCWEKQVQEHVPLIFSLRIDFLCSKEKVHPVREYIIECLATSPIPHMHLLAMLTITLHYSMSGDPVLSSRLTITLNSSLRRCGCAQNWQSLLAITKQPRMPAWIFDFGKNLVQFW